jgi:hypothetical protein
LIKKKAGMGYTDFAKGVIMGNKGISPAPIANLYRRKGFLS